MSFNYGTDEEIKGSTSIKKWPKTGKRTALLDSDAIAYKVGFTSDLQEYLKMKREGNWRESEIWRSKMTHASYYINSWVTKAKCDSALLYLTDSASNFRLDIAKSRVYKGERLPDKPPFFYEVKAWVEEFHEALISRNCEADDEISIEAWKRHLEFDGELWSEEHKAFSDFVIVSNDKDLGIIPGWRCHPDVGVLEWVEPLGYLEPIWKEKDAVKYEYWPLFKGKVKDLIACYSPAMHGGKIKMRIKGELKTPKNKWEMDNVWYSKSIKQDCFSRGKQAGKGKFKRVKVGTHKTEFLYKLKGAGLKFFYCQLIVGDTVDNFEGIPTKGQVFAYELLKDLESEETMHKAVYGAYKDHFRKDTIATYKMSESGQLAFMQTYEGELWQMLKPNSQSFPG